MGTHNVQPKVGTTVRERDGKSVASLMSTSDYPILAECMGCGQRIRLGHFYTAAWEHVPPAYMQQGA